MFITSTNGFYQWKLNKLLKKNEDRCVAYVVPTFNDNNGYSSTITHLSSPHDILLWIIAFFNRHFLLKMFLIWVQRCFKILNSRLYNAILFNEQDSSNHNYGSVISDRYLVIYECINFSLIRGRPCVNRV